MDLCLGKGRYSAVLGFDPSTLWQSSEWTIISRLVYHDNIVASFRHPAWFEVSQCCSYLQERKSSFIWKLSTSLPNIPVLKDSENVIYRHIIQHLDDHRFRKHRSCEGQLILTLRPLVKSAAPETSLSTSKMWYSESTFEMDWDVADFKIAKSSLWWGMLDLFWSSRVCPQSASLPRTSVPSILTSHRVWGYLEMTVSSTE